MIIIPKNIDEELELEQGQNAYIIQENQKPTTIIFCKGTIKGKIVSEPYKVQNYDATTKTTNPLLSYTYAIIRIPENKFNIPNQHKCQKLMLQEKDTTDKDFIIILR